MLKRLAAIAFAVFFLTGICATAARADGDPASDVLYTQWTFVPTDAGIPAPERSRLMALAAEARKVRFPIKVAIISSSYDLGSIAVLWRRPQTYARYLGAELLRLYRGRLLIEMPNGFGIFYGKQSIIREEALLEQIRINPRDTARAAIVAVQRLAAQAGHKLALPATAAPVHHSRVSNSTWIALASGLLLVGGVWGISLRLRPLRSSRSSSNE